MKFINRAVLQHVQNRLECGQVVLLLGARRVGKTELLRRVEQEFEGKTLFINSETVNAQLLFEPRTAEHYRKTFSSFDLVLIDEVQELPNAAKNLKLLVDEVPSLRVLASGSAPIGVREVGEPLVGRSKVLYMYPLAYGEIAAHENPLQIQANLEERLIYGSYPRVWQLSHYTDKAEYLDNLVSSLLLKDVLSIGGVRHSSKLIDLLRLIAFQVGQEVSLPELSRQIGIDKNTTERYLDLLQKVFVIIKRQGFSRNLRKEIAKSSRWYFLDNGIMNTIVQNFRPLSVREDVGRLWENYCVAERLKFHAYSRRMFVNSYFWRTYDQQEIDIVEEEGIATGGLAAFECKWSPTAKHSTPKAWKEAYPNVPLQVIHRENYSEFFSLPDT